MSNSIISCDVLQRIVTFFAFAEPGWVWSACDTFDPWATEFDTLEIDGPSDVKSQAH